MLCTVFATQTSMITLSWNLTVKLHTHVSMSKHLTFWQDQLILEFQLQCFDLETPRLNNLILELTMNLLTNTTATCAWPCVLTLGIQTIDLRRNGLCSIDTTILTTQPMSGMVMMSLMKIQIQKIFMFIELGINIDLWSESKLTMTIMSFRLNHMEETTMLLYSVQA